VKRLIATFVFAALALVASGCSSDSGPPTLEGAVADAEVVVQDASGSSTQLWTDVRATAVEFDALANGLPADLRPQWDMLLADLNHLADDVESGTITEASRSDWAQFTTDAKAFGEKLNNSDNNRGAGLIPAWDKLVAQIDQADAQF
jgi:hypothetical protein